MVRLNKYSADTALFLRRFVRLSNPAANHFLAMVEMQGELGGVRMEHGLGMQFCRRRLRQKTTITVCLHPQAIWLSRTQPELVALLAKPHAAFVRVLMRLKF